MPAYVVDASVAVKWVLMEADSAAARALLQPEFALSAPEFILAEVGNVLWKRLRRGEIGQDSAEAAVEAMLSRPLTLHSSGALLSHALNLAVETGRTVYDSLYLALAIDLETPLITADQRFYNAVRGTRFGASLQWIEDEL